MQMVEQPLHRGSIQDARESSIQSSEGNTYGDVSYMRHRLIADRDSDSMSHCISNQHLNGKGHDSCLLLR